MNELFLNPITVIATLLAAFFILMAFLRHVNYKREHNRRSTDKPYRVTDPFSSPVAPPPPAPSTRFIASETPAAKSSSQPKVFRQFGADPQSAGGTTVDPADYIWE